MLCFVLCILDDALIKKHEKKKPAEWWLLGFECEIIRFVHIMIRAQTQTFPFGFVQQFTVLK